MFERFTPATRQVLARAPGHARDLSRDATGTEHLFLALLDLEPADALDALAVVDRAAARARARDLSSLEGRSSVADRGTTPRVPPFTRQSKRALGQAFGLSLQYGHRHVGPGHLLAALVEHPPDSNAIRLLVDLGIDVAALQAAEPVAPPGPPPSPDPPPTPRHRQVVEGPDSRPSRADITTSASST